MLKVTADQFAEQFGNQFDASAGWVIWVVVIASLVWLFSVVQVASTRTKDPTDRIVWLLVVLMLHIVGSVLYWIFCDAESEDQSQEKQHSSEDAIKERANRGTLL